MKYFMTLFIVPFYFAIVFSQQLPEFIVSNSFEQPYFSRISFSESESQKINENYLFTSDVSLNSKDSIVTNTLLFGFTKNIVRIRIKKISFSRNGVEYISEDSFPAGDSLKWRLVEKLKNDSLLFLDSLLYIKLSMMNGGLRLQLDKEYTIRKDDTFKILLDTLPQREIVGILRLNKAVNLSPYKNKVAMLINIRGTQASLEGFLYSDFFNLAGKRQYIVNKGSNVFISKPK